MGLYVSQSQLLNDSCFVKVDKKNMTVLFENTCEQSK